MEGRETEMAILHQTALHLPQHQLLQKILLDVYVISVFFLYNLYLQVPGADPGFQVRGKRLEKLRRAEGGAKILGVFCVKNHGFMPKNHIFF